MAVKFVRFNHIAINQPVGELEKSRQFYGGVLGLKEITPPKIVGEFSGFDFLWFELPSCWIHLRFVLPSLSEMKSKFIQLKDEDKPHFGVEVEDIKQVRKEMEANNVYIFEAPVLEDRDRFLITDPFGNVIELIEMHCNQKNYINRL